MSKFEEAEINGRKAYWKTDYLFKGDYDYQFTQYQYEKYDVIYPEIDRVDEIKFRNIYSGEYIWKGYILEKTKYDEMMKHNQAYYVNYFDKDKTVLVWDLNNITEPEWSVWNCTENTVDNYTEKKEDKKKKVCTSLKYEDAVMITKVVGNRLVPIKRNERYNMKGYLSELYKKSLNKRE